MGNRGYNPFKWSYGPLSVTPRDPPYMEVVVVFL